MPARRGPKPTITTAELLEAVDWLGIRWTLLFAGQEITTVNEALDRELLAGTLATAYALSPLGRDVLERERGTGPRGRLLVTEDIACQVHDECHAIVCSRCGTSLGTHVVTGALRATVEKIMADHVCRLS